jgi:nucleotide-binding universal stress UspA family protein
MTAIGTILCAVDQSDISERALRYATAAAVAHHARLHLVQVAEAEAPEPDPDALRQFAADAIRAGVVADMTIRQGPVAREILAETERTQANLLVLGSHGRHGFQRLVLGSVTTKILHTATCPVLVVPPGAPPSAEQPFRTILCPTDFSAAGNAALTFARVMAAPGDTTTLVLLHVVEWPFGEATGDDAVSELRRSLESQGQEQLEHLAATQSLVSPAPEIQTVVAAGKPSREIGALARSKGADLIVMGVTGRGAIDLALLGSTTHQVVRAAPCPVLSVPLKHEH